MSKNPSIKERLLSISASDYQRIIPIQRWLKYIVQERDSMKEKEDIEMIEMIQLPGLPESLSAFTFPVTLNEVTEIYFDEELCYWIFDEGEIRKTLFSSAEEGEIPEVSYIVEFDKEFFLVTPVELSVEGRFSSVEEVLAVATYESIGKEPFEEIDYVSACLLDREADDEEVDFIVDRGLFDWMEMNANYEGSYDQEEGTSETYSYDIYELFDGYFVLDPYERSVLGKFTSYESAHEGANEEFFGDEEEEDETEDDD